MTVLSDLYAERQVEGYGENHTSGGSSLTERYLCEWADRLTYKSLLIGAALSDSSSYPGWACTGVNIAPRGWETGETTPNKAELTATYQDRTSAAASGATNSVALSDWAEHWEGGGEAITVGRGFKWLIDNKSVGNDQSGVKVFPHATITLTGNTAKAQVGKGNVLAKIGTINNAAYTIKGVSYAENTLLFQGADFQETRNVASDTVNPSDHRAQVTIKFSVRVGATWNEFWREDIDPPGWDEMVDSAGNQPYDPATFSDLDPKNW